MTGSGTYIQFGCAMLPTVTIDDDDHVVLLSADIDLPSCTQVNLTICAILQPAGFPPLRAPTSLLNRSRLY